MKLRPVTAHVLLAVLIASSASAGDVSAPDAAGADSPVTIVALGDSITKGVRPGVKPEETFAAIVERELRTRGIAASVVNTGVGGERTEGALKRLEKDVIGRRPRIVTVMYGTNDSYVDRGKRNSRLTVEAYRQNLRAIVEELLRQGIEPVLMTEPRWARDAAPNGAGEHPNLRLERYMEACRDVARECRLPLVDHFTDWTAAENDGQNLRDWTTDGCHPNPRGHEEIAATLLPVVLEVLKRSCKRAIWTEPNAKPALPQIAVALEAGRPVTIVCFGDSVTGLYYHTGGRRAYTDMLKLALERLFPKADMKAVNAGISGHTTREALERIERDVLAHKPDVVSVMFGLNDMSRVPLDEYRDNLREIVRRCRSAGAEVVLCTPNSVIGTGRAGETLATYCAAVRRVSREEAVPLCDCFEAFEAVHLRDPLEWRLTMSDEIHPNMAGHKFIAEEIAWTITGKCVSLYNVEPPQPAIPRTWIMNWSLSFGAQEWDCVVVHPSVVAPRGADEKRDELVRRLVQSQDLSLIDRRATDDADGGEIFSKWLKRQWNRSHDDSGVEN
ncbi:MAG: hypothetical protein KY476_24110 [Planctomycetes bacterium]|nr:hypothetical protein [Planctomycetota bacterium]